MTIFIKNKHTLQIDEFKFRCCIGRKGSTRNKKEGDNKTPEGIYFTKRHIPGRKLLRSKYGGVAIPLDYPNPMDRRKRKTGYGIWVHGAGDDSRIQERYATEGCIAFYNRDILDLAKVIAPHNAVVMITGAGAHVNRKQDREAVYRSLRLWQEGWREAKNDVLKNAPKNIKQDGWRDPPPAMSHYPQCIVPGDSIASYKKYYIDCICVI